jgi:hypothetical protein
MTFDRVPWQQLHGCCAEVFRLPYSKQIPIHMGSKLFVKVMCNVRFRGGRGKDLLPKILKNFSRSLKIPSRLHPSVSYTAVLRRLPNFEQPAFCYRHADGARKFELRLIRRYVVCFFLLRQLVQDSCGVSMQLSNYLTCSKFP